jgi:ferrochelatase
MSRTAIVLFNLGGPDSLDAVHPFLLNLFSDPAIIAAPGPIRFILARLIAGRRASVAREIYAKIGGRSPILEQTWAQAEALNGVLGESFKTFVCMRYWHPRARAVAAEVKAWAPDRIILLPLYPQYSTTTSGSSIAEWRSEAMRIGLKADDGAICCYPAQSGFIEAIVDGIRPLLAQARQAGHARILFSAHGLPKRVIERGDPYQVHVEQTASAVVRSLEDETLDWSLAYQSRVGPLEWIGPSTESEIHRAAAENVGLVVVPIAFVSEHSETLVELDMEYGALAASFGLKTYLRAPTVGTAVSFIEGLAHLIEAVPMGAFACQPAPGQPFCSAERSRCPCLSKTQ